MDERKSNRRWALVTASVLAAVAVLWLLASDRLDTAALTNALGFKPAAKNKSVSATKPICSQAIVPTGVDCIPQHMANLPPDPGEAGKATIDGIDSDKDGVRDDVQRFIHEKWPDSERARMVLLQIAKSKQTAVHYGGDISKEEARKFMPQIMSRASCYANVGGDVLLQQGAMDEVLNKVTNTPERWQRAAKFSFQLAHDTYEMPDTYDIPALCGFDPDALPN